MPRLRTKAKKGIILGGLVLFFCLVARFVYAANYPPSVGTITPSSGTSNPNQAVIFTTTYIDPDGWQNIQYVHLLINTAINGSNCFYGYYNQNTKKLYLRNDANSSWLGGYAPGSANIIENSYAKLDCVTTAISVLGNTLTVKWSVIFKATFTGTKNVYLYVKDNANAYQGWAQKGTWRINNPPLIGSITPSSGVSNPNQSVNFTATYTDIDGWQNIQYAHLLINTTINGVNCFYGYYNQNTNKLYLRNDANTAWLGGFIPTSSYIIENSYVKLNCALTTVSGSGSTLTAKWNITFKSTFTGLKNTYLYVKDDSNAYHGWIQKGTWTINQLPIINSITPSNNSTFLAGAKINIQINASDPDNDPLQYQFSIGGTIKQPWSSTNTYAWQTTVSDTGYVNILCEVKDNKGAKVNKTITYRVINPTVQEVLQKVVDNYVKIYDMKADMTLSSTFNGQAFGQIEYCRYYFKAPNKEKTEAYSDSTRLTKREVNIINGSNMYLIDIVNKITQQVNLLSQAGISSAQFSQLDICYNSSNFLNNHTVTVNNSKTDFNQIIIALNAIPKAQNSLYSKLELYIDYKKGLLIKSLLYKVNNLLQSMELIETQKMANGSWLPKRINKIPVLTSGNLIEIATYNNLQINVGLTDLDFDPNRQ